MIRPTTITPVLTVLLLLLASQIGLSYAQASPPGVEERRIMDYWNPTRRIEAIPRDLVIDEHGQAYLRKPGGVLEPYGHPGLTQLDSRSAPITLERAPAGGSDTTPPVITNPIPSNGQIIGSSQTFSAKITDNSGRIKSVSFVITYPNGATQSFTPNFAGNDTWQTTLQGFSDGAWKWQIVAKDGAKPPNTATSPLISFTVNTGSSGSDIVPNAPWALGGQVQTAAGRIYFEMPSNATRNRWIAYVCSGTVATDGTQQRSIIITAAHCVYDDANKAFARNVLFIPDQAGTTGSGTDKDCSNDPLGCWTPSFGIVDTNWANLVFPYNIEWDYAYYIVKDSGAHLGATAPDALDSAAGSLGISFNTPMIGSLTHALGYSYSYDPQLMYCADDLDTEGAVNWWLPSCGLSGGSSGGPWMQPVDGGNGPIISVNSWAYTNSAGMAGPKLVGTSASCLFGQAKTINFGSVPNTFGDQGVVVGPATCP